MRARVELARDLTQLSTLTSFDRPGDRTDSSGRCANTVYPKSSQIALFYIPSDPMTPRLDTVVL